ncbi:hypothetical protein [Shewanella sp. HN-41]|uniref:hypothetical protein n=1 Tax=Shewanella sp. HN-41 TaxID=327275 RepID=UPI001111A912|nr:hypothetical protein [Shewanella sp. HN-41]
MNKSEREQLKSRYRELWRIVDGAIRKEDPIGLLELGAPPDEYAPEVGTILPRLKSASSESELCSIIHQEFLHWFGEPTAGPETVYESIAKDIWQKYHAEKNI